MNFTSNIVTDHKDLIHDVAFDFHGKRLATTSCDQYIKIYDLIDNEWKCTASIKGHSGVIWKVVWANPDFGQVIATCSYDKTVAVWEELPNDDESGRWVKRGNLVDSRSPIVDVKFAPRHQGLKLAMCSIDGNVHIYEAGDIMNLSQWTLQYEITCKATCSCIAWSHSRSHPSLLLVGCEEAAKHNILIFEYNSEARQWPKIDCISPEVTGPIRSINFSPNLGRNYDLVAVAASEIYLYQIKYNPQKSITNNSSAPKYEIRVVAQLKDHKATVWRLSWNITGTILASSGDDGCVRLWKSNYLGNWKNVSEIKSGKDSPNLRLNPISFNNKAPLEIQLQHSTPVNTIEEKPICH